MADDTKWTDVARDTRDQVELDSPLSTAVLLLEVLARRAASRTREARRPLAEIELLGPQRGGALAGDGTVAIEGVTVARTVGTAAATRFEGSAARGTRFELVPPIGPRSTESDSWTFEARGFGAHPESIVVFAARRGAPWRDGGVAVVRAVTVVRRGGRALVDVELDRPVRARGENLLVPAASARLKPSDLESQNPRRGELPAVGRADVTFELTLDALYPGIARGSVVVVDVAPEFDLRERQLYVSRVREVTVEAGDASTPPRTILTLEVDFGDDVPDAVSLRVHFDLVPAGRLADLPKSTIDLTDLRAGLAVVGPVDPPEGRTNLEQVFLLEDADGKGARVRGRLVFDAAERSARFTLLDDAAAVAVSTFKPPLSLYDGLVTLTEGETVEREVLGSGDGRRARQSFELARKPLTHLPAPIATDPPLSTLRIFVDGIAWEERETFYGAGPNDRIFVVEHAADGTATVIFGDGRRGARLPTGTDNVVARYRFGAGAPVPAPNTLRLLGAPKARLRSPLPFTPGRPVTPDDALVDEARAHALMLDRPVSAADFAALALRQGAVRAEAELAWLEDASTVGVRVVAIGPTDGDALEAALNQAAEPGTRVRVVLGTPFRLQWTLALRRSPRRPEDEVLDAVRAALIGPRGVLHVSNVPLGRVVFSRVHAAVLGVPGVSAMSASSWVLGDETIADPSGIRRLAPEQYVSLAEGDLVLSIRVEASASAGSAAEVSPRVAPREDL
jgi:predicted phage baseplate assembly protein